MAREASGGLPDPPTTLLALGGHPYGLPRATNRPEPAGTLPEPSHLFFFNGQVNYHDIQDEFREADHIGSLTDSLNV